MASSQSLLIGQIGQWAIWAGLAFFVLALLAALFGKGSPRVRKVSAVSYLMGTFSLFGAFGTLSWLFANNQFQFNYVWAHSDSSTAIYYKIAGVWSGQEGSFLLWACCSALFGALALRSTGVYRRWYVAAFALFLGSLCGILAYESPFKVAEGAIMNGIVYMPPDGNGLTPSLQNYWVVIHPPTIFLGFGSLAVLFCWSVSAILTRNLKDWAGMVRPWALVSLAILALGICMGGFWAYETLGWGGFWAWDPVENASFVPWLFLAAFVHGLIVQVSRGKWVWTNLLLGGLPFLWFVYGTFLTRSGLLSEVSVHSFAEMDRSALQILKWLMISATGVFAVMLVAPGLKLAKAATPKNSGPSDRETGYVGGVLFLSLLGTAIAVGMSVPFFTALAGQTAKVVDEALYHKVVVWFFVPILILSAVGPFLSWRKTDKTRFWSRFGNVISLSLGFTGFCAFVFKIPDWGRELMAATIDFPFGMKVYAFYWVLVLVFFCLLALIANLWRAAETIKQGRSSWGAFVSHAGLAILMMGLIVSRGFEKKEQVFVTQNQPAQALGYTIRYTGMSGTETDDLYKRDNEALFTLTRGDEVINASPGFFLMKQDDGDEQAFVWPHIQRGLDHDLYMTMYEPIIRAWDNPEKIPLGGEKTLNGITVRYLEPTVEGEAGQAGATFGAKLEVITSDGKFEAHPKLVLLQNVADYIPSPAGPDLVMFIDGVDVKTKAISVQVLFHSPIYPIDLYYKPLTLFVWVGTGILTLGGLLAAYARRRAPVRVVEEVGAAPEATPQKEDALVPVTQS